MTAAHDVTGGQKELARRLRELRVNRWPGRSVPQRVLAQALGRERPLSLSLISAWENENSPTAPPQNRLHDYATFFATERSLTVGKGVLIPEDELTAAEVAARDELLKELLSLRDDVRAAPPAGSQTRFDWTFPRRASVHIVCGKLDKLSHEYTILNKPNYTDLLTFADLDALIELHGHAWRVNPDCSIRFLRADRLTTGTVADELHSHLILLGGIGLNELTESVLRESGLPIAQKRHPDFEDIGEVFEVTKGDGEKIEFLPRMSEEGLVVEDVGLLARMPNPNNSSTTLTICNGVFARGVYGAVRTLTDDTLRRQNEAYLAKRFAGVDRFAILMRVKVRLGTVLTPDLQDERTRLYEWSDEPGR